MDIVRNWPRRSGSTRTIYLGRQYYDNYKELRESPKFPAANNNNNHAGLKKQHSWKALWRKLLKERKKIFEPCVHLKFPYDEQSYMENFDDGQSLDDDDEAENGLVSRSFSMRFADPSRLFRDKDVGM